MVVQSKKSSVSAKIFRDIVIWFLVAMFFTFMIFILQANEILATMFYYSGGVWVLLVPFGYVMYIVNLYWLIPGYEEAGKNVRHYVLRLLFTASLITIPSFFFFSTFPFMRATSTSTTERTSVEGKSTSTRTTSKSEPNVSLMLFFLIWTSQIITGTLIAWGVYEHDKERIKLRLLRTELGKTTSDLQFLRSQINPHFLFNALNTVYGTALQENSERTAQSIQKLGDMMRFMLHENIKDKIKITHEINYLRQYVDLQMLRINLSPDIHIETNINESLCGHEIAPMLLVPFVENAFKHGISLQHKSWVKIALHCDKEKLYLDVYNSTHAGSKSDPEKEYSGVGLENVKQRLVHLYPDKHELLIRKTDEEYIIHLTVQFT